MIVCMIAATTFAQYEVQCEDTTVIFMALTSVIIKATCFTGKQ